MLEILGLNELTIAVYSAMIAHRSWGVAQIAEKLKVAESVVRDELSQLAELTLVRQSLTDPNQLHPVDPELGLQSLLRTQQADLLSRQRALVEGEAAVSGLIAELRPHVASIEIEQLIGIDAVQGRIELLAARATTDCLSFMPGGGQSAASIAAGLPLNEAALRRGVSVQTVYLDSVRNHAPTRHYARQLAEIGGEVRTAPALPTRLLIVDREIALLPLNPHNSQEGAAQVVGCGVVAALVAIFEQVWATATPFCRQPGRDQQGLNGQERELLQLLARGLTDDAAAKRLGLSLRTVRRMMADLMERLGARSRFEAGLQVAAHGWLSP
ncbi:LuxR C-terminal-related transcriptional regulator [Micromonospora zamorensis]|uniref:LuxR C-terminal-related transcriptional regulator n=1 Tax=Micromonospora zamorensis TaxID=709883 RepID=UPI0033D8A543